MNHCLLILYRCLNSPGRTHDSLGTGTERKEASDEDEESVEEDIAQKEIPNKKESAAMKVFSLRGGVISLCSFFLCTNDQNARRTDSQRLPQ